MKTYLTVMATVLVLGSASICRAESGEGNGDPFPFAVTPQVTSGSPFVSDRAQDNYPHPTGTTDRRSSLALLEPAFGTEAVVQTGNSLPARANEGTVAYARAQSLKRAAQAGHGRVWEAGVPQPRG